MDEKQWIKVEWRPAADVFDFSNPPKDKDKIIVFRLLNEELHAATFPVNSKLKLSRQQKSILLALLKAHKPMPVYELHSHLWGISPEKGKREPLTNAKSASLSRSIHRLIEHGLVSKVDNEIGLTMAGYGQASYISTNWLGGLDEMVAKFVEEQVNRVFGEP